MMRAGVRNRVASRGSSKGNSSFVPEEIAASENDQPMFTSPILLAIVLVLYMALGMSYYSMIAGHDALTAAYFCVQTLMTIGYGDVSVHDHQFTTFYVLLGAGLIGTFFGMVAAQIMEEEGEKTDQRLELLGDQMIAIMTGDHPHNHPDITSPQSNEWDGEARLPQHSQAQIQAMDVLNLTNYEHEIFNLKMAGMINLIIILVTLFVGAAAMSSLEGWSFSVACYWSAVTATSVGYGDVVPITDGGKIFTIFFAIFGCLMTVKGFSEMVRFPMTIRAMENEMRISKQFLRGLSEKTMIGMIENAMFRRVPNLKIHPKELRKSEFVLVLLTMMGKVAEKDVLMAATMFERIDTDRDGVLREDDWNAELHRARVRDAEREEEELAKLDEETKGGVKSIMLRGFGQAFGIRSMSGGNVNVSSTQGDPGSSGEPGGGSSVVLPPVKNHGRASGQNLGTVSNPLHNTVPTVHPSTTSPSNLTRPSGSSSYSSTYHVPPPLVKNTGTVGDDSFEIHGKANVGDLLETGNAVGNNNNNNNNNPITASPAAVQANASNVTTPQSLHQHQHTHSTGTQSYHSTLSLLSSQSQSQPQPQSQPSSHHSHVSTPQQLKSPYHEVTNTSGSVGRKTMVGLTPGSSGSGGSRGGGMTSGGVTSSYDDDVDRLVVSAIPTIPPTLFSSPVGHDRTPTTALSKNSPVVNPFQNLPPRSSSSPTISFAGVPPVGVVGVASTGPPSDEPTQLNPEQAPELWNTPPRTMNNTNPSLTPNTNSTTRRNNDEKAEWDNIMNNMWSPG